MSKQWQNPSLCCKKIRLLSSRNPFYACELAFFPIHLLLSPLSMITLHLIPQAGLLYHTYTMSLSMPFSVFLAQANFYILESFDASKFKHTSKFKLIFISLSEQAQPIYLNNMRYCVLLRPKNIFPFFIINYFFLWKICSIESRKLFSAFCQW